MGMRDLPAMIDYILKTTGRKKLFYFGHSQGTTTFFVMSSQLPEYQDKVHAMFAMAPVSYSSRMISPILQLTAKFSTSINVRSPPKLKNEPATLVGPLTHTYKRVNNM